MTDAERLAEARRIIQEWLDQQRHDRCWYYPDLFNQLAECLEVRPAVAPELPPLSEFQDGCRQYQREQYAECLASLSATVAEAFHSETGFLDPRKKE